MWHTLICRNDESWLQKRRFISFFEEVLHQSHSTIFELETDEAKIVRFKASCQFPIGWCSCKKIHFHSLFIHFQSTVKQHVFLSLQRWYWVISRIWTRFSYSDCERSCPGKANKVPRISSGSFQLVVVTNTKMFENNHLSWVPITPNQQRTQEMGKDVLFSVGAQDMDTLGSEVSELEDIEFFPENPPLEANAVFRPGIDTFFPQKAFDIF